MKENNNFKEIKENRGLLVRTNKQLKDILQVQSTIVALNERATGMLKRINIMVQMQIIEDIENIKNMDVQKEINECEEMIAINGEKLIESIKIQKRIIDTMKNIYSDIERLKGEGNELRE